MKFIVAVILTAFLTYAIGLFAILPWYSFTLCAFIVAVAIRQKPWQSFLAGFVAVFLLWAALAFRIDNLNEHILSVKVANILPLHGSSVVLIAITGLIGGLVAGLGALTGSYLGKAK